MTVHLLSEAASRRDPLSGPALEANASARTGCLPPTTIRLTLGFANRAMALFDWIVLSMLVAWAVTPLSSGGWVGALLLGGAGAAGVVAVMGILQSYRVEHYLRASQWLFDASCAWLIAAAVSGILKLVFGADASWEPVQALGGAGLGLVLIIGARAAAAAAFAHFWACGAFRRQIAFLYPDPQTGGPALEVEANEPGAEFVGAFRDVEDLCRFARMHRVDLVVINDWAMGGAALPALVDRLQWISADVVIPLRLSEHLRDPRLVATVLGVPMLRIVHHPLKGGQGIAKLIEDYLVATLALLVASPIMAATAIAVRLTSPGPILFKQTRIGLNGRPFEIYKFRTMRIGTGGDGSEQAVKDDCRLTPIGRLLRKTSIDELPQMFNVLKGQMSVVGPRPHVPNIVIGDVLYSDAVANYCARHRVKPGLTGWAQINGARGGIHTTAKARAAADADLYYISNWSLALDLRIMLRTFGHLVASPNVY